MCPRPKAGEPPTSWYALCCAYLVTPQHVRKRISRQTLAHYRRIAGLPRHLGEELDRLHAPFYVMRWIAWGGDPAERSRRHAQIMVLRARLGRWPYGAELSTASALGAEPGETPSAGRR